MMGWMVEAVWVSEDDYLMFVCPNRRVTRQEIAKNPDICYEYFSGLTLSVAFKKVIFITI